VSEEVWDRVERKLSEQLAAKDPEAAGETDDPLDSEDPFESDYPFAIKGKTDDDPHDGPNDPDDSKYMRGLERLNELVENDGGVSRFTANALEQAPSGGGGGDATEAKQDTIIALIGAPAADLAADIAAVQSDVTAILEDTATTLPGTLTTVLSALTTIDTVVDAILLDTGTTGVVVAASSKTGYALSATGVDLVVPADPTSIPVAGTANLRQWIGYFGMWSTGDARATNELASIRNAAGTVVALHELSDDGTTFQSDDAEAP